MFFLPLVHPLIDLFGLKFSQFSHLYKLQLMQVLNIHLLELLTRHKPIKPTFISSFSDKSKTYIIIDMFFSFINKPLWCFNSNILKIIFFHFRKNVEITSNGNKDKAYSINTRIRRLE